MAELISSLNNVFFTGKISGQYNHSNPIGVAKEVVKTLTDDACIFMFAHNQSGLRLVYGYVYSYRRYGVVYVEQFSMSTVRVDINNGEYILRG